MSFASVLIRTHENADMVCISNVAWQAALDSSLSPLAQGVSHLYVGRRPILQDGKGVASPLWRRQGCFVERVVKNAQLSEKGNAVRFRLVIFLWLADSVEGIERFRLTWLGQPEMTSIAESSKRGSRFLSFSPRFRKTA